MELITKEDCQEVLEQMAYIEKIVEKSMAARTLTMQGEKYLTGEQLCRLLNITKRTLQEYRNNRMISYIDFFGKTLYKESDILDLLNENYVPRFEDYDLYRLVAKNRP